GGFTQGERQGGQKRLGFAEMGLGERADIGDDMRGLEGDGNGGLTRRQEGRFLMDALESVVRGKPLASGEAGGGKRFTGSIHDCGRFERFPAAPGIYGANTLVERRVGCRKAAEIGLEGLGEEKVADLPGFVAADGSGEGVATDFLECGGDANGIAGELK